MKLLFCILIFELIGRILPIFTSSMFSLSMKEQNKFNLLEEEI